MEEDPFINFNFWFEEFIQERVYFIYLYLVERCSLFSFKLSVSLCWDKRLLRTIAILHQYFKFKKHFSSVIKNFSRRNVTSNLLEWIGRLVLEDFVVSWCFKSWILSRYLICFESPQTSCLMPKKNRWCLLHSYDYIFFQITEVSTFDLFHDISIGLAS